MMLNQLVERVEGLELIGDGGVAINGVTHDSRCVEPGALFVALPGRNMDGLRFVPAAIAKGAAALGIDQDAEVEAAIPVLKMGDAAGGVPFQRSLCGSYQTIDKGSSAILKLIEHASLTAFAA